MSTSPTWSPRHLRALATALATVLVLGPAAALLGCGHDRDQSGTPGTNSCPTCPDLGTSNLIVLGMVSDMMFPEAVVYVVDRNGVAKHATVTINGLPLAWAGDEETEDGGYYLDNLPLEAGVKLRLEVARGGVISQETAFPGQVQLTAPLNEHCSKVMDE